MVDLGWFVAHCSSYECFILRAVRLSNKLLGQGYVKERLKSSLRKFYGRYGDLTKQYEAPLSRMLHDILDNIYGDLNKQYEVPLSRMLQDILDNDHNIVDNSIVFRSSK